MPQAISNRVAVAVTEEATFNTTPATPPMYGQRYLSATLTGQPITKISNEIVSDRNVADLIIVGKDVAGDIGFELSHRNPNQLIEGALFNPWVKTPEALGATVITGVTATQYTLSSPTGTPRQYQLFNATGFANAGNNRVVSAGVATGATAIIITAGVAETPSGLTPRLKCIGFEGPSADLVATSAGMTSTLINFTNMGLAIGMWIYVGGTQTVNQYATAGSKGYCRISAVAAASLTFDRKPTGWGADAGAGKLIRVYFSDYVRNGVTRKSYTIEQQFLDITQNQYATGAVVASMDMEAKSQDLMLMKFGFMGAGHSLSASRVAGAVDWVAPTEDVMNASSHVAQLNENGAALGTPNFVSSFSLNVNNNLRGLKAISSLTPVSINPGRCVVTGKLSAYFGDLTLLNQVLNNTRVSFDTAFQDANGNAMYVDLPAVELSSGSVAIPGIDQDLMTDLGMQALKHATLGYAIHMQRFELIGS